MDVHIRLITEADYPQVLAVYAPYALHTAITFEYDVPSLDEFSQRLRTISHLYPILVCEVEGTVAAYCYGSMHRFKTAYQWSVESTIYISEAYQNKGLGSILYSCLFDILRLQGFINVYAGVSVPRGQSDKFHHRFGFKELCVFEKIGYKHDQWHDLKWFEYGLSNHIDDPSAPVPIQTMQDNETVLEILDRETKRLHAALAKA
ncbi:MAG: phosphinothricin acetyltransferase [Bacteroidetes bacterium]|nr:phosphinothricin acetyltransferase [Bacteroidota bacterium]